MFDENLMNKSTISNLEHKLLLVFSSLIPFAILCLIALEIYFSFFPPPPPPNVNSNFSICVFPTPFEYPFIFSAILFGCLTNLYVLKRRYFASWFWLIVPVTLSIFFGYEQISRFYLSETLYIQNKSFIHAFEIHHLFLGGIIISLFLWHTKIVIQDKFRKSQQNLNLP